MRVQLRDEEPTEGAVRVERIGGVPRRVFAGTALVVGVIVVALIKPWGEPSGRVPPSPPVALHATPSVTPAAQATATADPEVIAAEAGALCFAVPTWRLITMETSELGNTRTIYATPAVAAAGPDDTPIPQTDVTATRLIAIGVCRPSSAGDLGGGSPAPSSMRTFGRSAQTVSRCGKQRLSLTRTCSPSVRPTTHRRPWRLGRLAAIRSKYRTAPAPARACGSPWTSQLTQG